MISVLFRLSKLARPQLEYGPLKKAFADLAPAHPVQVRQTVLQIRDGKLPDPAVLGSAGSFFINPVVSKEVFDRVVATPRSDAVPHYEVGPDQIKIPAAWLIDQCGLKGAIHGQAAVYEKQPLVIVNATGDAPPQDILTLEQKVIDTVRQKFGIELSPEVEHI